MIVKTKGIPKMWKKSNIYSESAIAYDAYIRDIVPVYGKMQDVIVEMLCQMNNKKSVSSVIELGVGTGMLAYRLLSKVIIRKYTGYESSEEFASIAKTRLQLFCCDTNLRTEDFRSAAFPKSVNAVVSTMTMHYLSNMEKKELFKKIYNCLVSKGVVIIGDRVISKDPCLQSIFKKRMTHFWDTTTKNWQLKLRRQHNTVNEPTEEPWYLEDQISWLKAIGFSQVDCIWRDFNYCVFYGLKTRK